MRRTAANIAHTLNIPYCGGIYKGFRCYEEHKLNGSVTNGIMHLEDRLVNRYTIASVLKLAARAQDPTLADDVPWRRVYRTSVAVQALAATARVRYSRESFKADRAFVLANVAGMPNEVPLRRQAFDWARR